MAQPVIQSSFNAGEWSPKLLARTDLEKYRSAAALLRNFFVDYRGGASTRAGTQYCLQAFKSATAVRLIPFQASFIVGYVLEFGDQYIRFFNNGAPVLETGINITGATKANPCVLSVVNSWSNGDWIYVSGVGGMTQLNGRYFIVANRTANTVELKDLFGANVNSAGYDTYTSGGSAQRIYTLTSPYAAADLELLKFAQNVTTMIICHPDYAPRELEIISAANWTLNTITFGTTLSAPSNMGAYTTLSAGTVNYSYIVTAVDENGQESEPSAAATLSNKQDLRTVAGTNYIGWAGVTGAVSYNVYKSDVTINNPVPAGVPYGFIGNTTNTTFPDSNIGADFSQGPPVVRNPFNVGSGIASVTITTPGSYTTAPTAAFAAPPVGITATGDVVMKAVSQAIQAGGSGYVIGEQLLFNGGAIITVNNVAAGVITAATLSAAGIFAGALPANPVAPIGTTGAGTGATFNFAYGVLSITMTEQGSGYSSPPSVTFSAGAAAGTAVLGPSQAGNPSVPVFFQQRLVLAAPRVAPQTVYMSQPGSFYNFNVSNPVQDDNAITASLISGQLNNIKSMVPQPAGLIVLADGASWLINGGSNGSAVTPSTVVANAQSFNGANDVPPIVSNFDILYVQAKGSSVRDSSYNFYANVFTGTDISILSSHLFFGYHIQEWAWAEEPYKIVWAIRNDGMLLSLTFMKEQEFVGWAHSDTDGSFKSVATIVEEGQQGHANAVYFVVERTINSQTVKYIERMAERYWPNGATDAWCVDAGLQYSGAAATTFTGGEHLAGKTVTGLADGVVITPFVMPANGSFTLATAASKVTVGLSFTPQLQTMYIDTGPPTIQSKQKKINAVTVRASETLGIKIGSDSNNLVVMKDFVVGNVGSITNIVVTDLVTGDGRTFIDPKWSEQGQFYIQQDLPFPATILGVIPQLAVGDTPK